MFFIHRDLNDFYATDPESVAIFLNRLHEDGIRLHQNIWENACGNGVICKVLQKFGYYTFASDIVNRGYPSEKSAVLMDFTKQVSFRWKGDIVTNPPYKNAMQFLENSLKAVDSGRYVVLYLRLQFLESKGRLSFFKKYPPKFVYIHSERQSTYKGGIVTKTKPNAVCFAWFVWQKGSVSEPILRWL